MVYCGAAEPRPGAWTPWWTPCPQLPDVHVALVSCTAERKNAPTEPAGARQEPGWRPGAPAAVRAALAEVVGVPRAGRRWGDPDPPLPNHEIALITKFFEYSHARLPIVVTDVRDDGRDGPLDRSGRGVPGRGRHDYVRAVRRCSPTRALPRGYDRRALDGWTWEAQAAGPGRRLPPAGPAGRRPARPAATAESEGPETAPPV